MEIRQITLLGSGTMGRGIAHIAALSGYETVMYDVSLELLHAAREAIEAAMSKGVAKGKLDRTEMAKALSRIQISAEIADAARDADLVIEAIPENLQLKKDAFSQVDLYCGEETILATNTSSLSVSELSGAVERRDRFVGMHFFNPPHLMKLVEIVRGERTSDETVEIARQVAIRMKKEPIVVKDSPGFASSRLGIAIGLEAMRMLEEGVASAEDIDRAMELGYNHPMGPLRLSDLVGLDVRFSIAEYLAKEIGPRFDPPLILRKLVADGKLGKKSGEGFYKWDAE